MQIHGCRWIPSTIRGQEGSAFVAWGDTPYNANIASTWDRNFYYIKMDYNMWIRTIRVFGRSTGSEWATSKMYLDMYGNMYIAGWSQTWCPTANSMMIMKNNFEMDMWETHTSGDRWSTFIIAYPNQVVVYPNWWLNDANYCGHACMAQYGCVYFCGATVVNYYQNLE